MKNINLFNAPPHISCSSDDSHRIPRLAKPMGTVVQQMRRKAPGWMDPAGTAALPLPPPSPLYALRAALQPGRVPQASCRSSLAVVLPPFLGPAIARGRQIPPKTEWKRARRPFTHRSQTQPNGFPFQDPSCQPKGGARILRMRPMQPVPMVNREAPPRTQRTRLVQRLFTGVRSWRLGISLPERRLGVPHIFEFRTASDIGLFNEFIQRYPAAAG